MTLPSPLPAFPPARGKLIPGAALAPYTWFRVGGPADALFLPEDANDLAGFLAALDPSVPVTALGVGSNLIVRDGGIDGVVIRLMGRAWGEVMKTGELELTAGAGALDLAVARAAGKHGITGLEFLSGIPGSLGGATRTNAGCYGRELKDVLVRLEGITRTGERRTYGDGHGAVHFSYRHSDLPEDFIVTRLVLRGTGLDDPAEIAAQIDALQARRAETQPIREKTSGSTFANPDPPGTPDQRSAWKLIDAAGCRGLKVGGAQVSPMHCNFLINTGEATAADLEALGELVRARVLEHSGVSLRWEVRRIGRLQTA
ncbi:MAG: UDP-N-acetylmuramate dehydrogenase [Hyphomonas sp.]|uniref:UDP-N-acetylmuramate dehydrogenase n=1 Tax=Hyphomonas sp. TaxID=87 RepID=UPI00180A3869|nr:UDP-N-acetylmuramate dehydrogenase [Hyphomonas sp.]MBA3068420.1 UDP-N-acetylmuramate dehydrogenase [Hyphomonas sp.]MBU3919587.1 UDP-N-acetylmuramate dehydrogenase [Alphaproteobacteria bacterium]MBU4060712.1 UDP-N-acetylmuramate dehydrogenase [Alphaproteobacteria bacterium]MBU4164696.1 UDP-N-acetylmuramate dehydrogenase [Alphaproteobacteria bacterium]